MTVQTIAKVISSFPFEAFSHVDSQRKFQQQQICSNSPAGHDISCLAIGTTNNAVLAKFFVWFYAATCATQLNPSSWKVHDDCIGRYENVKLGLFAAVHCKNFGAKCLQHDTRLPAERSGDELAAAMRLLQVLPKVLLG